MNSQPTTILVIDDEEAIRQSTGDYLEDLGYEVLTAENGRTGVELFERLGADLVLVDLRMPEMDGLEVLDHIRETNSDTPMIVVSGTGVITDAIEALHKGAWDYVLKPIEDFSVLVHAIDQALEKKRLKLENRQYQKHLEQMVADRTQELEEANQYLTHINARLKRIVDTTRKLSFCSEVQAFGSQLLDEFGQHMQASGGSLYFIEENGFHLAHTLGPDYAPDFIPFPVPNTSVFHRVIDEKKPLLIRDIAAEKNISSSGWPYYKDGSALIFPMPDESGKISAVLTLHSKTPPPFMEQDKEIGSILASYSCEALRAVRATESLREREQQLRQAQKMEAIGTLAGGIAHDFNNILAVILGSVELAIMDTPEDSQTLKDLSQAREGCHRAADLVKQILFFSRQQDIDRKPLYVRFVIKEVIRMLRSTLPATIEINQEIDQDSGMMLADPAQVHQIVMNLATNATHAMEETGGILEFKLNDVELTGSDMPGDLNPGPYLKLTVSDTGHGMDKATQERIFDPYFSTKAPDKGTGLGLSVVMGIVKNYGGTISVSSEPGKGTRFDLFFPRIDEASQKEQTDTVKPTLPHGSERVLFVDDEVQLAMVSRNMLQTLGYKVHVELDSLEALDRFKENPSHFDLVITDVTMPKMTGDMLSRELLKIRPDLPIILCTGFSQRIDEEKAKLMGVKEFLVKPLQIETLANTVRKVLDA